MTPTTRGTPAERYASLVARHEADFFEFQNAAPGTPQEEAARQKVWAIPWAEKFLAVAESCPQDRDGRGTP